MNDRKRATAAFIDIDALLQDTWLQVISLRHGPTFQDGDPAFEKHNHLEQIELRYEKITWTYKDGNIIHSDSWNERATA